MDFSNYDLVELKDSREYPGGVYSLADGVLREIARSFGVHLSSEPAIDELQRLISAVGPAKTLQDNIEHVTSILGSDAVEIASDWLERSGTMSALAGSFSNPSVELPLDVDATIILGGTANWMWRRFTQLVQLNAKQTGKVVWALGKRVMGYGEHELVGRIARINNVLPTEFDFCNFYFKEFLQKVNPRVEFLSVPSTNGDEVCLAAANAVPRALDGTALVIGNAPNTVQSAGQFRAAAQQLNPTFDVQGTQLFMLGDYFPVARNGEDKRTHQDPRSGLGQLCRDALSLQRAIQSIRA